MYCTHSTFPASLWHRRALYKGLSFTHSFIHTFIHRWTTPQRLWLRPSFFSTTTSLGVKHTYHVSLCVFVYICLCGRDARIRLRLSQCGKNILTRLSVRGRFRPTVVIRLTAKWKNIKCRIESVLITSCWLVSVIWASSQRRSKSVLFHFQTPPPL